MLTMTLRERLTTHENGWWCRRQDLNLQPSAYKAGALPLSYAGSGSRVRPKYRAKGLRRVPRRSGVGYGVLI